MGKALVIEVGKDQSGEEISGLIQRFYPDYMNAEVRIVSSPARAAQSHIVAALLGREMEVNLAWASSSATELRRTELQTLRVATGRTVVLAEGPIVQDLAKDYGVEMDLADPWVVVELLEDLETAFRRQNEVFPVSQTTSTALLPSQSLPSDLEAIHLQSRLTTVNALLARCQAELQELDRTGQLYEEEPFLYILSDIQVKDSVVQLRVANRQGKRLEGLALEVKDELGTVLMQVGGVDPGLQTVRFRVKLELNTVKSLKVVFKRGNRDISNQREITVNASMVHIEELKSAISHSVNPPEDSKQPF